MNSFKLILIATVTLFFTAGCVQQEGVYANYVMPPKKIQNISEIKDIKINLNKLSISGFSKNVKPDIQEMVEGKLSAIINKEQFLNVYDNAINKDIIRFNKNSKNHHGYGKFYADNPKFATLQLQIDLKLVKNSGVDNVQTTLKYQAYGVEYSKKGVPMAKPSGDPKYTKVSTKVDYTDYKLVANINAIIYNNQKKVIYNKTFNNITLTKKIGGDTLKSADIPTELELVSSLLVPKFTEIIFDISPHKESRKLVVNETGDKSVVALMKGTAFSEAVVLLDSVIEKQENEVKTKKTEVEKSYEEKFTKAKDEKEKSELEKSKENDILALYKLIAPNYDNMGILNEIFGDLISAKYYYELASKYDSSLASAKTSIQRVENTLSKVEQLKKLDAKIKNNYKNQENKER